MTLVWRIFVRFTGNFSEGEWIVYPKHGLGKTLGFEKQVFSEAEEILGLENTTEKVKQTRLKNLFKHFLQVQMMHDCVYYNASDQKVFNNFLLFINQLFHSRDFAKSMKAASQLGICVHYNTWLQSQKAMMTAHDELLRKSLGEQFLLNKTVAFGVCDNLNYK